MNWLTMGWEAKAFWQAKLLALLLLVCVLLAVIHVWRKRPDDAKDSLVSGLVKPLGSPLGRVALFGIWFGWAICLAVSVWMVAGGYLRPWLPLLAAILGALVVLDSIGPEPTFTDGPSARVKQWRTFVFYSRVFAAAPLAATPAVLVPVTWAADFLAIEGTPKAPPEMEDGIDAADFDEVFAYAQRLTFDTNTSHKVSDHTVLKRMLVRTLDTLRPGVTRPRTPPDTTYVYGPMAHIAPEARSYLTYHNGRRPLRRITSRITVDSAPVSGRPLSGTWRKEFSGLRLAYGTNYIYYDSTVFVNRDSILARRLVFHVPLGGNTVTGVDTTWARYRVNIRGLSNFSRAIFFGDPCSCEYCSTHGWMESCDS